VGWDQGGGEESEKKKGSMVDTYISFFLELRSSCRRGEKGGGVQGEGGRHACFLFLILLCLRVGIGNRTKGRGGGERKGEGGKGEGVASFRPSLL